MFIRWTIALFGVAALAALTVTAQMPWLTKSHPEMVVQQPGGGEGSGASAEPILSCR